METLKNIETYARKAEEKRNNYDFLLEREEFEKAGESLWGAIVNLIDSIRLAKGASLNNHNIMRRFLKSYAFDKEDKELWELFKEAEKLHPNFYHSFMDKDYFEETCIGALKVYDKLKVFSYEEMENLRLRMNGISPE